jgi:hypothetical protein
MTIKMQQQSNMCTLSRFFLSKGVCVKNKKKEGRDVFACPAEILM